MRKTSRSFLTVGTVLGFIFGAIFFIFGIILAVVGKMKVDQNFVEAFKDIIVNNFKGDVNKFQAFCFTYGVTLIIAALARIAGGVFCIITKAKPKTVNCVVTIVLMAIGGGVFGLLGAIFALIANAKKEE